MDCLEGEGEETMNEQKALVAKQLATKRQLVNDLRTLLKKESANFLKGHLKATMTDIRLGKVKIASIEAQIKEEERKLLKLEDKFFNIKG